MCVCVCVCVCGVCVRAPCPRAALASSDTVGALPPPPRAGVIPRPGPRGAESTLHPPGFASWRARAAWVGAAKLLSYPRPGFPPCPPRWAPLPRPSAPAAGPRPARQVAQPRTSDGEPPAEGASGSPSQRAPARAASPRLQPGFPPRPIPWLPRWPPWPIRSGGAGLGWERSPGRLGAQSEHPVALLRRPRAPRPRRRLRGPAPPPPPDPRRGRGASPCLPESGGPAGTCRGDPENLVTGLSSSSDRSESSSGENQTVDGESQDLSHSEQGDNSEKLGLISEPSSPPDNLVQPKPDLASAISTWVQFEEETQWTSTLTTHKETGGTGGKAPPITMSCWTCPSFDSLGRCPLASESSWTTRSEDTSSPSIGPSYTDIQALDPEDQTSGGASGADSADNSSSLQEDEEVEMETISWHTSGPAMNGHSATPVTSVRFPSWVTFDDNEISCPLPQNISTLKSDPASIVPSIQDVNCNLTGSFKKRERPKSSLVDFTKVQKLDISSLNQPPSISEPPPWRATNPFLNETLKDVQPSPINPFSAFFEEQERRSHNNSICSTTGKSQRDSLIVIYQESDAITFDDSVKKKAQSDAVEKLKQLQIGDPDHLGSTTLPDDDPALWGGLDDELKSSALSRSRDGWPMMLRIPEKKNIMSSRHWGPIYVKLTDSGYLQLYYEKGLEKPFREFKLEICHEISEPKLQNYDENGRIHSMRIDRVTYKEKKKYQPKPAVAHMAEREQVIKLGTTSYEDFLSFIRAIQDHLMSLPVSSMDLSTVGLNYLEEEITVDVKDEFSGVLSKGDNQILHHQVLTHIHVLSFLSGLAECHLGLNDILVKGNEIVSRQDIMPTTTTKWIKLHNYQFHGCVDEEVFNNSRIILFNPLDACRFELMRFRTIFAEKTLPFTLRTVASINGAEVELQSWLRMSTGFSSNRDPLTQVPCENVMIRYPVPNEWVKNFRRESVLGEKSLKAKVNKGASFGSTSISGSEPVMRVTLGTAKYEHAFNSIVWRINRLPDKNSASGHPHCFFCHLELGSDREVPSKFAHHVNVEFNMPTTSASKATVRSISVEDKTDVRKWVNYSAHYSYKVEIEQKQNLKSNFEGDEIENPKECGVQ